MVPKWDTRCKCGHTLAEHFFNRVCLKCYNECSKFEPPKEKYAK